MLTTKYGGAYTKDMRNTHNHTPFDYYPSSKIPARVRSTFELAQRLRGLDISWTYDVTGIKNGFVVHHFIAGQVEHDYIVVPFDEDELGGFGVAYDENGDEFLSLKEVRKTIVSWTIA